MDYAQFLRMQVRELEAQSTARIALKVYTERGSSWQVERVQKWLEEEL